MARTCALLAAGSLALGALPSCVPPPAQRDVLLVTIDTLRADHVSAYGRPDAPATPAIDALAAQAVLFEQAVAPAPLTLPSHASLLTGQWPFRHGARDNGGFRLPAAAVSLAEVLRARGYSTAAFVGSFVLDSRFGLDQGFEHYDDSMQAPAGAGGGDVEPAAYLGDVRRDGAAVAAAAAAWLRHAGPGPLFVWVHLYDPHAPYEAASPFRERYPSRPYAAAVAQADAALGEVLAAFGRRARAASAVVAVAGDHGEGLGEHGERTHGVFVYDSTLRVPLVLRAPDLPRGERISWQVRLIDLAPTLLALVGAGAPRPAAPPPGAAAPGADATGTAALESVEGPRSELQPDGVDLSAALRGESPAPELPAYAESLFGAYHYGWSPLRALRQGGVKWIEAPRAELYDLRRDPGETEDLSVREPQHGRSLSARLRQIAGETAAPPPPDSVDAETRARLGALGYAGGPGRAGDGSPAPDGGAAPDPKDGIHRHTRFEAAFAEAARAFDAGDYAGARRRAAALLRQFPEARDALRLRALAALNAGLEAPARADLQRLLREDPRDAEALAGLGRVLERAGQGTAALELYLRALESGPERPLLLLRAGRLLRLHGRPREAEARLGRALEIDPGLAGAAYEQALVLIGRGEQQAAEPWIRRALALDSGLRGVHHNLALILEERGDLSSARREYEAEIAAHPPAAASRRNLDLLLQRLGESAAGP